jgi:hypothetical protein
VQFGTADEANRFLVEQIIQEARRSGVVLSALDEHELRTPGCGHTIEEDEQLDAQLPAGYSHWALRAKAARLLRRAYDAERRDHVTRGDFHAAYRAMRKAPYILTNLTHADSPILNAVERFHLQSAFESATLSLVGILPFSPVPMQAAHRPMVVIAVVAMVIAGLGIAAAILLWR